MNLPHSSKILLWKNNQKLNQFNDYQAWLEKRNLTTETIQIKLRQIKQYGEQALTTEKIVDFLKKNSNYTPYHLNNLKNSLVSYCKFLKIENKIEWDLVSRIIPSIQPKLFPTIDYQDLAKLKSAVTKTDKKIKERNDLILDFFFYTGLRISELVNIKHSDYQHNQLIVQGKGNKIRFIPLPNFLVKHFNNSSQYLFQTKTGNKLHVSQVRRMIYQRNRKANLSKHISPHTFRRSFATLSNNQGIKLTTIQKVLGHRDINTTTAYIHHSYEEIYQDYSKLWQSKVL